MTIKLVYSYTKSNEEKKKSCKKKTNESISLFLWKKALKVPEVFNFTETPGDTQDMGKQYTAN